MEEVLSVAYLMFKILFRDIGNYHFNFLIRLKKIMRNCNFSI